MNWLKFQKIASHLGHVEYPGRECKYDIQESEGNMFNPIYIT